MQCARQHPFGGFASAPDRIAVSGLLPFFALLSGCLSDAELLAENSRIALQTAEMRGAGELDCPRVKAAIVTEKEVPGQPLGELYSEYGVRVDGCGRTVFYDIECRDEKICAVREKPLPK
ncbi:MULTISPECIES: hypothetical protein [unclassified Methylococcus]|uniref:hypothetical protein n=1 Tax=unclassified Methylococcus TaxID=2618889 RepID=UPI003D7C97EB